MNEREKKPTDEIPASRSHFQANLGVHWQLAAGMTRQLYYSVLELSLT